MSPTKERLIRQNRVLIKWVSEKTGHVVRVESPRIHKDQKTITVIHTK